MGPPPRPPVEVNSRGGTGSIGSKGTVPLTTAGDDKLVDLAHSLSPRIDVANDCVYLDLGRPKEEASLADLILQAAEKCGIKVQLGIASNKWVALMAARHAPAGPVLVREGEEANYLAPLPLGDFFIPKKLAETFQRWGIKTAGELAKLPSKKIMNALGREGWALQQAAKGVDFEPFVPFRGAPVFLEKSEFDWPIGDWGSLQAQCEPLLERLVQQLRFKDQACQVLDVTLQLEPSGEEKRSIRLRAPTREIRTLLRLIQGQLTARPPQAPILGICLLAHPDAPQQAQLSLFGPPALSPVKLATALAQLSTLLGPDRVGSPETMDGYRPERFVMEEFAPPPAPLLPDIADPAEPPNRRSLTAIRVLRPPQPIEVTRASAWPWEPIQIQSATVKGPIRAASGPWRLEEQWWSEHYVVRDYWDVELESGELCRVFEELNSKRWFVDGVYD